LYITTPTAKGAHREEHNDARSTGLSYRTVRDENEEEGLHRIEAERESLGQMNSEERFEHLKNEIDRLEKERSEVIMASKPNRKRVNYLTALLVLLFMVILGNLTGKMLAYEGR
jgi:chromosome segregation ATPase